MHRHRLRGLRCAPVERDPIVKRRAREMRVHWRAVEPHTVFVECSGRTFAFQAPLKVRCHYLCGCGDCLFNLLVQSDNPS
ncbi:hypothetical protein DENSPDRAFT_833905 [Dentipellis sp. KUC8613]|nr:hypothetical protein DENSPDRAFT_833905 [Dentipellis sp. KUC8613]